MAKNKTLNIVLKVFGYLLLLVLLGGMIGGIVYYTNGLTTDFTSFYLTVNDKNVMENKSGYELTDQAPLNVNVKYTFGAFDKEKTGYSIKVVPANDVDFNFEVAKDVYSFAAGEDYSEGFIIEQSSSSFKITPKGDLPMIMAYCYPDISMIYTQDLDPTKDLFKVIVTSYNGKANIELGIRVPIGESGPVDSITKIIVTPDHIVF